MLIWPINYFLANPLIVKRERLLASCVVSATFRFWSVFSFSGSLLKMLFALFYSYKHPVFFFINAPTIQGLNSQDWHHSSKLTRHTSVLDTNIHNDFSQSYIKRRGNPYTKIILWEIGSFTLFSSLCVSSQSPVRDKKEGLQWR